MISIRESPVSIPIQGIIQYIRLDDKARLFKISICVSADQSVNLIGLFLIACQIVSGIREYDKFMLYAALSKKSIQFFRLRKTHG